MKSSLSQSALQYQILSDHCCQKSVGLSTKAAQAGGNTEERDHERDHQAGRRGLWTVINYS